MTEKVVVFSDYICPFCLIGKDRVDRLRREFDVEVEWKNIRIHPEIPQEGVEEDYSSNYMKNAWLHVNSLAKEANIEIHPPRRIANSKNTIEISEYAKEKGKFEEFHSEVFRAYFVQGLNIGDPKVLSQIGTGIEMKASEITDVIATGRYYDALLRNEEEAVKYRVTGVPTFIIKEKKIVGAQPYSQFREVFLDPKARGDEELVAF